MGYGRETCNPAARYLVAHCGPAVESIVWEIWGIVLDEAYDAGLAGLEKAVLDYLESHPELREQANEEDMWDYRDPEEDVDRYDEDEEDW